MISSFKFPAESRDLQAFRRGFREAEHALERLATSKALLGKGPASEPIKAKLDELQREVAVFIHKAGELWNIVGESKTLE